ncbi:hypothetical protein Angca_004177 [Angiostrongylus cantonensis]|nr:hypothetical protein Angca_004177 [Angiostrongylus cantonensis]
MSGPGKRSKKVGKGEAKRHRKQLKKNIQEIIKPEIRRLARRGEVRLFYGETHGVLKIFLEMVTRDAVTYYERAKRKAVRAMDVVCALKR